MISVHELACFGGGKAPQDFLLQPISIQLYAANIILLSVMCIVDPAQMHLIVHPLSILYNRPEANDCLS